MKNFLSTIGLLGLCIMAYMGLSSHTSTYSSPSPNGVSYPMGTSKDTLTNAVNDTFYWPSRWGGKQGVTFQYNFSKISGTAGGTIKIYGSADNGGSYGTSPLTTLSIDTSSKQQRQYSLAGNGYDHYMSVVIDTGTQVNTVQGWVYPQ